MSGLPKLDTLMHQGGGLVLYGAPLVALLAFLRWLLTLAGARQDARITKLEAMHQSVTHELQATHQECTAKMIALAHALIEVMALLDRHPTPDAELMKTRLEAVHRARLALVAVFSLPALMPENLEAKP